MSLVSLSLSVRKVQRLWMRLPALLVLAGLVLFNGGAVSSVAAAATQSSLSAQVTLNSSLLGIIPRTAFGVNDAVWDGNLLDSNLPGLLAADGVQMMRYPGGSTADVYHWQSDTTVPGQSYASPSNTFDAFMGVVHATGAQSMITVNYGSGTPQEAAGWVQYANKGGANYNGPVPTYTGGSSTGHTYGVKYWEIGNEIYGNGTYGADWEYDVNGLGPTTYANNVVAYSQAMKAVDPSIKVGVVLTAPSNWPDGQTSASSPQPWNDTVLPIACSSVDFVVVHWYPQGPTGESDAGLLAAPQNGESTSVSYTQSIPQMMATLHSDISKYCGKHADDVKVMVTETNSVSYNPGKQTTNLVNALYLAENYMTWLENGAANVDWWDVHNGAVGGTNDSSSLYGDTQYGDYGLLANGSCVSAGVCEPAAETPTPAYYGLQMLTKLGHSGDIMLGATSNQSLISVFAVLNRGGRLTFLLVNTDPTNSYDVTFPGLSGHFNAHISFYGENSTGITTQEVHHFSDQVLPPYSLTAITFTPAF